MKRFDLRRDDGVAMTEFALVAPVLLLLVAGMLGFGRVLFYWISANHLANETARWAVVDRRPDPSLTLQDYARRNGGTAEFGDSKVCIVYLGTAPAPALGDPIQVKISKPFTLVPLLRVGTITIRGSSTQRIERFANGTSPSYSYGTVAAPGPGAPFGACT